MKIKLLLITLLISSCSPTVKNFDEYQKQFLSKATFMPSKEEVKGKIPKIVVFPFDENDNETAKQAALGKSIANNLESILSKNKLGKLVDRKAGKKLQKEIALAESKKTGSYKGPQIAQYAVLGEISNAGFTSKYRNGTTYVSNGQLTTIPPKYIYTANSAGNIKIYELPSLSVAQVIDFSYKISRSEAVRQDGGISLGGIQIGGKKVAGASRDDSLVRKSAKLAVKDVETEIKNFFAKRGFILEKRTRNKRDIFKINLGSLDGIKEGDKFEIVSKYEVENSITQEIEVERRIIAKGLVSNIVNPKNAWVIISDKKQTKKIRLGDTVKIKYQRGFWQKLIRKFK